MTAENRISRSKNYLLYLLIILLVVDILDTYSTNYINTFPSKIIAEFLSGYSESEASAIYLFCTGIATFGSFFVFVAMALADKFGRKTLLVTTTFGMGFASLLLALSFNMVTFTIFLFMVYMFFSSDMWLIYVNEESPAEKRAVYTNIVLAGGVIGAILMSVFRPIFITDVTANWRGMTFFPIFVGIPLGIIIFFSLKETSKYEEAVADGSKGSIMLTTNIKDIFTSPAKKEFIIVLIMSFINSLCYSFIVSGENFIHNNSILIEKDINNLIIVIALSVIIGYLSTGILADKIGRRPLLIFHSILMPISIILVLVGVGMTQGAFTVIALGTGLYYVSFWGLMVCLRLIAVEIVATDKRGTGSGLRALVSSIGITSGLFIAGGLVLLIGEANTYVVLAFPVLINVFLCIKYIKETKGIDLSKIE